MFLLRLEIEFVLILLELRRFLIGSSCDWKFEFGSWVKPGGVRPAATTDCHFADTYRGIYYSSTQITIKVLACQETKGSSKMGMDRRVAERRLSLLDQFRNGRWGEIDWV